MTFVQGPVGEEVISTQSPRAGDPSVLRLEQGLPVYRSGTAPAHLGTRRQLHEAGLSTAGLQPAAWLHYSALHGVCALYERAAARPIRPLTARQREALAAGRRLANTRPCRRCKVRMRWHRSWGTPLCEDCSVVLNQEQLEREAEAHRQMLAAARAEASAWAREVLSDPHAVILDTETTGLEDSYAVQLAVITVTGTVLTDTLLNPQMAIPAEATAIHGITDEMVTDAPLFSDVLQDLARALHSRRVVIYNAPFDTGVLWRELDRHYQAADPQPEPDRSGRHPSSVRWMQRLGRVECAMEQYAAFAGQWHDYFGNFTWQPLGGGHQALADCQTVITRLKEMAIADEPGGGVIWNEIRR